MMNSPLYLRFKRRGKKRCLSKHNCVRIMVQVPKLEFGTGDCKKWIDSGHIVQILPVEC